MHKKRNVGATALTAAITAALVSIPVVLTVGAMSGSPAPAITSAAAGVGPSAWLTLTTGAVDRVALDRGRDGSAERTQALSEGQNCKLTTDGSLLSFTGFVGTSVGPAGNLASFAANSIGVAEKKSGTSCYQVGLPDEKLILSLNPTNVRGALGPYVGSAALLDVELKQGAQILAILQKGTLVTGYRELRSGPSITSPQPRPSGIPAATPAEVSTCNNPADSGPDAGVSDNCRWAVSTPSWLGDDGVDFDTMTLVPLNGAFSLEGGSDGVVTSYSKPLGSATTDQPAAGTPVPGQASFFELGDVADGILDCDEATITREGAGTTPEVTVRRLDNLSDPCTAVPYLLTNEPNGARFLKPLDSQLTAQFVSDLLWTLPTSSTTTSLPPTKVDFETPTAGTQITLGWCPDPVFDGTTVIGDATVPKLVGIGSPLSQTDMDEAPGIQYACVGLQQAQVADADPDTVKLVEQVYILGDIKLLR